MIAKEVLRRWLDIVMPHRQGPQVGKVVQFSDGTGGGVCGAKIRILTPGGLEETERVIEDVPVPLVWWGAQGKGVYTPLATGTLVIVGYLEHNPAYPYIGGIWGEFSGLTKLETLFTELGKNVDVLQSLTTILGGASINEPGNGSPSALQAALSVALTGKSVGNVTELESTVVKNG